MIRIYIALATILLSIATLVLTGCGGEARAPLSGNTDPTHTLVATPSSGQPYTGLQNRVVKALSTERVADLLEGRGAGYAQAAELNHYPGPRHVLDLKSQLKLTVDQEDKVHELYQSMDLEAKSLGKQIVDSETELDREFNSGSIIPETLSRLAAQIHDLEGRLRDTHLVAHVKTRTVLSTDQVALYDQLRGYATNGQPGSETQPPHQMQHPGTAEGTPTPQP